MAVFSYHAIASGQPQRGTITADTVALARHVLRAQGLTIVAIGPLLRRNEGLFQRRAARLGPDALAELWRQIALLLKTGVPLAEALGVLVRQHRGTTQALLRQVQESIQAGRSLSDALADHPACFDGLTLCLVRVGQSAGCLDSALGELAEFQARSRALRTRLTTVLIYPAILCLVGFGVVVFLMSYVLPQLIEVLAAAGRDLPVPTRILQTASNWLIQLWPLLMAAGILLAFGSTAAWRWARGRRRIESTILYLPVVGDLIRKAWVARVAMMLSVLLRSSVSFVDALRTIRSNMQQQLLAEELERLQQAIEAGSDIAGPLRSSRLMPPLVVHVLAVGQDAGELPSMLDQLREGYEKEVQVAASRFLAALEPTLILILAGVIGFVLYAALLPILETTKVVQ